MPAKAKITFAESAIKDLEEIKFWYIKHEVPDVGIRLVREIFTQVERLALFPESGRIVPEFGITNLREIIFKPFRIIYRLDKTKIRIVRIWRSERMLRHP